MILASPIASPIAVLHTNGQQPISWGQIQEPSLSPRIEGVKINRGQFNIASCEAKIHILCKKLPYFAIFKPFLVLKHLKYPKFGFLYST